MRTRETLELVLVGFQERPLCVVEDNFYLAECRQLIARLQRLEESFSNVLLIGHNPGLHQLAIALAEPSPLARSFSNKFPTLARASYRIGTEWSRIGDVQHRLMGYATPLSLSERRD
jgi:phosphohistidine phosphatase